MGFLDSELSTRSFEEWQAEIDAKWAAMTPEEREARQAENRRKAEENDKKPLDQILREIDQAVAAACGKPDWTYRDLPKMTTELFDQFRETAGADNLHWITLASYTQRDGTQSRRGQVLISPDGMKNIQKWLHKQTD